MLVPNSCLVEMRTVLDISARSLRTDALTAAVALQKGGTLVKHNRRCCRCCSNNNNDSDVL